MAFNLDLSISKAKELNTENWCQGFFWKDNSNAYIKTEDQKDIKIDVNTLCHCTGMKDNNDKLIFENDIILSQSYETPPYSKKKKEKRLLGTVKYQISPNKHGSESDWEAGWCVKYDEEEHFEYSYGAWGDFYDCEVIGNIFDKGDIDYENK